MIQSIATPIQQWLRYSTFAYRYTNSVKAVRAIPERFSDDCLRGVDVIMIMMMKMMTR